jgi:phosphoribosylformylglycinamidine synthase
MPKAVISVKLKPALLDAQGLSVANALRQMGYQNVSQVRIGKLIEVELAGEGDPKQQVEEMCRKLLANPVTEEFDIEVVA